MNNTRTYEQHAYIQKSRNMTVERCDPCGQQRRDCCCCHDHKRKPKSLTLTVTTLNNSGRGSLRSAIDKANACKPKDGTTILFSVRGTIFLQGAPLPAITSKVTIDATTTPGNPNSAQMPTIEIDCNSLAYGLKFETRSAAGSTVAGIAVVNSSGTGIVIDETSDITIYGCRVGVGLDNVRKPNGSGISAVASKNVRIGLNPLHVSGFASNVISGNKGPGIVIENSSDFTIVSNFVGTDATGMVKMGNEGNGAILMLGAARCRIGGTVITNSDGVTNNPTGSKGTVPPVTIFPPLGNLISGNGAIGVAIYSNASTQNVLNGNFIGTDVTGNTALGNGSLGVFINAPNTFIVGCSVDDEPFVYYNVISGNSSSLLGFGMVIDGDDCVVHANFVGIGMDDKTPVPNGMDGVMLETCKRTQVGGVIPLGNVISRNARDGITIKSTAFENVVTGNYVGLNALQEHAPNGGVAINDEAPAGQNAVFANFTFP